MEMDVHVTLPPHLVAIPRHPGYFWHMVDEKVFSIKIGGVLKPIQRKIYHGPTLSGGIINFDGYVVSVNGVRRYLNHSRLLETEVKDSVVDYGTR